MKIILIRNTVACGHPVEIGQIIECPDAEARHLIAVHKAVLAPPDQLVVEAAVAPAVEVAMRPKAKRKPRARKGKK